MAVLLAMLVAACSRPSSIAVELASSTAFITESVQASATLFGVPGSQAVTWSSSDESVAVVSSTGLVTAVDVGTAVITATSVSTPTVSGEAQLTVASPLTDTTIVYFVDLAVGTDVAALALQHAGDALGATVVVADSGSLVADIADEPDLVVYFRQDSNELPDEHVDALIDWVAAGGALAFTHWKLGSTTGEAVWTALQTALDGNLNYDGMNVTQMELGLGMGATTVPLVTPGWGTFNVGLEPTGAAQSWALYEESESSAIVVGNGGRTAAIGFLSDTMPEEDGARLYLNLFYSLVLAD